MAKARTTIARESATAVAAAKDVNDLKNSVATEVANDVQAAVADVAETTQASLETAAAAVAKPDVTFKQGITKTMKTAEEVVAFGQGNVEALIKSSQIWNAGVQDLSKQFASTLQANYEEAVAAFKALTTVKSLKEAVDLQVGFARSAIEKSVAESSKYTDASFKLAEQAIAPISSRLTLAVEKASKAA